MADIYQSWRRFKLGLALFAGGVLVLLTLGHIPVAYYLSLAVLLCGFSIAMWGYAGIFLQRFSGLKHARNKNKNHPF